jgi:hypothetical protein
MEEGPAFYRSALLKKGLSFPDFDSYGDALDSPKRLHDTHLQPQILSISTATGSYARIRRDGSWPWVAGRAMLKVTDGPGYRPGSEAFIDTSVRFL